MSTAKTDQIEIKDVGPNEYVAIPYRPGVTLLRGDNDRGKTEALKATQKLVGGNEKLTRRIGCAGRGSVEGLDGKNRQLVDQHAKDRGVMVLTAEASRDPEDSGEVRAEVYE